MPKVLLRTARRGMLLVIMPVMGPTQPMEWLETNFMPPEATYSQTEIPMGSYTLYRYTSADSMPCMYLGFEVDAETYALLKTKFEEPGIPVNPYFYIQELRIVDENTALATLKSYISSSTSWELTYSLSTGNINAESEPNEHTTPVWKLIDVKEEFHPEMVGNPNESADTIFYHRLFGTDYYLSFNAIRYRSNTQSGFTYKLPYDYKVYYVNSNDTTRIGYIDAKLPAEIATVLTSRGL